MAKNPLIRKIKPTKTVNNLNQSAGILDDYALRKTIATQQGTIEHTPTANSDIANKAYVDSIGGGPHALLSATHTDTDPQAVTRGSVIVADSTPEWTELVVGGAGEVVRTDGTDTTFGELLLDEVGNPSGEVTFNMANKAIIYNFTNPGADGAMELNASGAFTGDVLHVHQHTGNPGATNLIHLEASDADVQPLRIEGSSTYDIITTQSVNIGGDIVVGGTVDGVDIATRDHDAVTLNASATTGGMGLSTQEITNRAATNAQTGYATAAHITAIEANTTDRHASGSDDQVAGDFNHDDLANISGTPTEYNHPTDAQVGAFHTAGTDPNDHASGSDDQVSGDFTHDDLISGTIADHDTGATGTELDTLTDGSDADGLHAHAVNDAKNTNVTTNITVVEAPTNVDIQSSDGTNDTIAAADVTNAGVMTTTMYDEHVVNTAHAIDNTQAHTDYLLNNDDDTTTGLLSMSGATILTDTTVSGASLVRNFLIGTEETPPAASSVTQGTLYVQYTA